MSSAKIWAGPTQYNLSGISCPCQQNPSYMIWCLTSKLYLECHTAASSTPRRSNLYHSLSYSVETELLTLNQVGSYGDCSVTGYASFASDKQSGPQYHQRRLYQQHIWTTSIAEG